MKRMRAIVERVLAWLLRRGAAPARRTTIDPVSSSVVRTLAPLPRGWKGQVAQHRPLTEAEELAARRSLPLVDDDDSEGAA